MYVILWEYHVKPDRVAEFEEIYSAKGRWAQLFQKHPGYLGTDLLNDLSDSHRYITIDRWISLSQYESFLSQWKTEYATLDARCEGLTENESLLGRWEVISSETR